MADATLLEEPVERNEDYCPITYIYGLQDPISGFIRYVGKSDSPRRRYHSHLSAYGLATDCHRSRWLRKMKEQGGCPILMTLEAVSWDNWAEAEQRWIAQMRSISGHLLTNSKEGGLGGANPCEETRSRMRERRRDWWASLTNDERQEFSTERSKKQQRGPLKQVTKERIRQASLGRKPTPQQREQCGGHWTRSSPPWQKTRETSDTFKSFSPICPHTAFSHPPSR